mmetsp:Transcript_40/g.143  ORF Transcript_40/g.143 Transcript_40/m.143 type:complete len:362 (+) Transcript_40:82-1167(+)
MRTRRGCSGAALCLLVLATCCGATILPLRSFDNFISDQYVNSVVTGPPTNGGGILGWTQSTMPDYRIPGNERDIALVATGGQENTFLSGGVENQVFHFESTPDVLGYALLQYDGQDRVTQLNGPTLNGLDSFDLTLNGLADSMQFMARSTVPNSIVFLSFYFYDSAGTLSSKEYVPPVPGGGQHLYNILFSELRGSADLSRLGALEIVVTQMTESHVEIAAFSISRDTSDLHGDTCHTALPASLGVTHQVGTEGLVYENVCGLDTQSPTTWFFVIPGGTARATFSTCGEGTDFDTVIAVFDDCEMLMCIAANDDGRCDEGLPSSSVASVNVQQGHVYFVMVAGYADASGLFTLTITADYDE